MEYIDKIIKLIKTGHIKTKYSHHNLVYRRLRKFIFSVDCSGLMEFWLKKKHSQALAEIYDYVYQNRNVPKCQIKRLYSFDFYDFFCALNNDDKKCSWEKVDITKHLQRGDVIAFINHHKKGRFGHVAIVDSEIRRTQNQIKVKVIRKEFFSRITTYPTTIYRIQASKIIVHISNFIIKILGTITEHITHRIIRI